MALNETLTYTVAMRDQMSQGLRKIGDEAKNVEKSIAGITGKDLETWGRGAMRGAATLATGLFGLAKASSDVAEAQNFTNQIFKDASPAITKFAQSADKALGLSQKAALDAAASLGIFGQRIKLSGPDLAKFSTDLVTLASDMASIKNTRVEDAVTAIAAAMRNEYEPIRRYGVVLNDVVLKARALEQGTYDGTGQLTQQQKIIAVNAELFEQLNFAMGDFQRTQGELANQQRIAQAQWENFRAELGDAVRPAFITMTASANDFLGVIRQIPEPILALGGGLVMAATAVLGLGGAFLFVAGKVTQGIESFKTFRLQMQGINESGTKTQKTMLGLGKAAAGIGVLAAATTVLFQTWNTLQDVSGKTARGFEQMQISMKKLDTEGVVKSFGKLVEAEDNTARLSMFWEAFGKTFKITALGINATIENVDRAFNKLSLEQQADLVRQLERTRDTLEEGSGQWNQVTELIDRYTPRVEDAVAATQAIGEAGQLSAETLEQFGDAELTAADNAEEASKALEEQAEHLLDLKDSLKEVESEFSQASRRAEAFGDTMEISGGTSRFIDNVSAILTGLSDMGKAWEDADGNIDASLATLDLFTEAGRANLATVDELAKTIEGELVRVYEETDGSIREVTKKSEEWNRALYDQVFALTGNAELAQQYVDTLNLTPESIQTAIELSGQENARQKLALLNLDMSKLPREVAVAITSAMDRGDFISAWTVAQNYINENPLEQGLEIDDPTRAVIDAVVIAKRVSKAQRIDAGLTIRASDSQIYGEINYVQTKANQNPVGVPIRALSDQTQLGATWAEVNGYYRNRPGDMPINAKAGDTTKAKNDMQNYYNNNPLTVKVNGVRGTNTGAGQGGARPMMVPMSSTTTGPQPFGVGAVTETFAVPSTVAAGVAAPTSTPAVFNLTVNMAPGTNENRVVDLLRRHARSNGRAAVAPLIRRRA